MSPAHHSKQPVVSVIIPAYNGEKIISACLRSVVRAVAGINHQIIVVESSGDGTSALVRQAFPLIELVESPTRLSAGHARNLGVSRANGRFLCFVDQDCLVPDDWIGRLLSHLEHPAVVGAGGSIAVANPENTSGWCVYFLEFLHHFPSRHPQIRADNFLLGANCAWKSEVFDRISFPDQTLGEDLLITHAVRSLGVSVVYDPSICVLHHNRQGWREFRRYCRAMGRAAAVDQQRLGGRWFRLIAQRPLLVFAIPLVVLPMIGWRLRQAPPFFLPRYLSLLPCCLFGQLLWAKAFRAALLSRSFAGASAARRTSASCARPG